MINTISHIIDEILFTSRMLWVQNGCVPIKVRTGDCLEKYL